MRAPFKQEYSELRSDHHVDGRAMRRLVSEVSLGLDSKQKPAPKPGAPGIGVELWVTLH